MNLCDDGHEEICFDGRKCPMCESIDDYDKKISDLEDEVHELSTALNIKIQEYNDLFDEVKSCYPEFVI